MEVTGLVVVVFLGWLAAAAVVGWAVGHGLRRAGRREESSGPDSSRPDSSRQPSSRSAAATPPAPLPRPRRPLRSRVTSGRNER